MSFYDNTDPIRYVPGDRTGIRGGTLPMPSVATILPAQ